MVRKVIWPSAAQKQLAKVYEYISSRSYQNAEKVKLDIFDSIRRLSSNPEMHPADKYRKNNDGSFRAYELHHYRIAYRVTSKAIIIVRVRHTNMEPRKY
jgi:plasmid stabilization system protein ParE